MKDEDSAIRPYIVKEFLLKHKKQLGNFKIDRAMPLDGILCINKFSKLTRESSKLFIIFPEYKNLYSISKSCNYSIGETLYKLKLPLSIVLTMISNMIEMRLITISGVNENNKSVDQGGFRRVVDKKVVIGLIKKIKAL